MTATLSAPRPSSTGGWQAMAVEQRRSPAPVAGVFAPQNRSPVPRSPIPRNVASLSLASLPRRDDHVADHGMPLPLLAPLLAGLRLRAGRYGTEFMLPNPSGGRGVYVTSWPVVAGFVTPSLHDTLLIERLSEQQRIDPQTVREAARGVAREGHAGAAAADAAREVDQALRIAALRLSGQLLIVLARRAGFIRPEDAARCFSRSGFHHLAGRLGWHGPELAEALRVVSAQYATVATGISAEQAGSSDGWGGSSGSAAGRWGRLDALLRRLRTALAEEQDGGHGSDGATLGRIIDAADRCLASVHTLLPMINRLLADPMPFLDSWRSGRAQEADWLTGLDSALDGWGRVCLLWFDPDTALRRQAVLAEMAVLTRTVGTTETRLPQDMQGDRVAQHQQLLARNERLRARELLLEAGNA